ncbi:MAG: coenzyme F420-0:L-glutamate ligase [Candidatus Acidiferrales bacterium]
MKKILDIPELKIAGIAGLPEIARGVDLGALITKAVAANGLRVGDGDIFVIAQKIVSKAEGRTVRLESVAPSTTAREWAAKYKKDARVVELVLRESRRMVKKEGGIIVAETKHGFVCANAGVDVSNAPLGCAILLPEDPDNSAERLKAALDKNLGLQMAVIIADTFGRPWREGLVNVALGVAGIAPLADYRGKLDSFGRPLQATVLAVADELASAAELVMGKSSRVPVALIQGYQYKERKGSGRELIRPAEKDLFR